MVTIDDDDEVFSSRAGHHANGQGIVMIITLSIITPIKKGY